nr:MAG TPA: hypothetical protein [Caudoviricetes sp.]
MAIYEFIKQVLTQLKEAEELKDITFLSEFPSSKKPVPIKKVTAALGGEEISVSQGAIGNVYDSGNGRDTEIALRLTVYAPYKSGGEECLKAFCRICETVSFMDNLNVKSLQCGDVSANRDADAFVLKGTISFSGEIVKEAE